MALGLNPISAAPNAAGIEATTPTILQSVAAVTIEDFAKRLRQYVPGSSDSVVEEQLRDALFEFYDRTEVARWGIEYLVTDADVEASANNSVLLLTGTVSEDLTPTRVKRLFMDATEYNVEYLAFYSDIEKLESIFEVSGTRYFDFPATQQIRVFPISLGDGGSARLYLEVAFVPLAAATEIDGQIYQFWHKVLRAGALARLYTIPQKPWTDWRMAEHYWRQWETGIGSAQSRDRMLTAGRHMPQGRMSFI